MVAKFQEQFKAGKFSWEFMEINRKQHGKLGRLKELTQLKAEVLVQFKIWLNPTLDYCSPDFVLFIHGLVLV